MSRAAVVADVHVGNHRQHGGTFTAGVNERCAKVLNVLGRSLELAVEEDVDAFVVAGDLLDVSKPRPQVLAELQRTFADARQHADWANVLVGNHEQVSADPNDHALGVLRPVATVHERPTVLRLPGTEGAAVVMVPYSPMRGVEWLEVALDMALTEGKPEGPLLLAIHLGVEDKRTPPWLKGAHDSIRVDDLRDLCELHGIKSVVAGNWHDHRRWEFSGGLEVVQAGALVPTGWDNPSTPRLGPRSDPYGSVILWDTVLPEGGRLKRRVLPGPRFLKTSSVSEAVRAEAEAEKLGHDLYVRLTASPDAVKEAGEALREAGVERSEVVADPDDVRRRVEQAALSARDAETTERAVAEYVERAHPAGSELDAAEVLRLCKGYVAGRKAQWTE